MSILITKMKDILLIYRGQVVNSEILERINNYKDNNITLVVEDSINLRIIKHILSDFDLEIITSEQFLDKDYMKKFDVVVGNYPYERRVGPTKTEPIWQLFAEKTITLLNPNGYLSVIHPSGWRNVDGKYKKVQKLILSHNLQYLEMHDKEDGVKTFGARTTYDVYTIKKELTDGNITEIKQLNGETVYQNLNGMEFVPSGNYDILDTLLAETGDETVNVLYSASDYEIRYDHMNKEKTEEFKHPCVYMIRVNEEPVFHYSNTDDNGHFGVPKFIWGNGGYNMGTIIDKNGEYGLTQFAYGIIDTPENLPKIKEAFDSEKFRSMMKSFDGGDSNINRKVISLFRKDFWKEFI